MRAITVQGLWAWAIVAGHKRVENRSWLTRYRGSLWIHCGLSRRSDAAARALLESLGVACPERDELDALRGKVIGACRLVSCEAVGDAATGLVDPYAIGPFCFGLADARRLAEPIACKGQLSLWTLPREVERRCREQLAASGNNPRCCG